MEWIDAFVRKPNGHEFVIVDGGIAWYHPMSDMWMSVTAIEYPGKPIQWPVRFWMPIPQIPVQKEIP